MSLTALFVVAISLVQTIAAVPTLHPVHLGHKMLDPSQDSSYRFNAMMGDDPSTFAPVPFAITNGALPDEFYANSWGEESSKSRVKRGAGDRAMQLSLSHSDRNGNRRPVGRLHGFSETRINGNNRNNFHYNSQDGVGSVVWRSRNNRHSVGVGAVMSSNRGRSRGTSYSSRPDVGVGIGYRMRF